MNLVKLNLTTLLLLLLILTTGCLKKVNVHEKGKAKIKFGLVIHGGAGNIRKDIFTKEQEQKYENKLREALLTGYSILEKGGSSVDAVEKTIQILEDSPLFNAGKGAVFTNAGTNEMDASIMDGKTLNAGAVAGVRHIKNPISLARLVMDRSPHVLLAGLGAEEFAKEMGVNLVDTSYFFTESRWKSLQRIKEKNALKKSKGQSFINLDKPDKFGTVGCAALDKYGNLAAGTSTGGMTNKMYGRIGDSPIIGAGTYANNKTCAVSATGHGEYFIRNVIAYDISAQMEYRHISLKRAAENDIMQKLVKQNAEGGVIAIDKLGNIVTTFNTKGMFRGFMVAGGEPIIKMYKD
ncbi:isoaspartyl peptidase precursor [bacterium BMS3Abin04]|nr:isoaspartyl peptidase precursor [bacterium BMS3Abin04]